jgi:hypothetical protein
LYCLFDRSRQMAGGGFVEDMMREQSLLEATCGDLFDHIDDLLDFPNEDSAAAVLLLDAPAPGSPLSARIIDVGRAGNALAPPAAPAQHDASASAFFAAAGNDVFDTKDVVGAHIGSVSLRLPRPLHVLVGSDGTRLLLFLFFFF